jgi:hypothetical protein
MLDAVAVIGGATIGVICAWLLRLLGTFAFRAIDTKFRDKQSRYHELAYTLVYSGAWIWIGVSAVAGYAFLRLVWWLAGCPL